MKKLFCVLALLVFCSTANAALVNNPESFEYADIACPWWPCHDWESWGSGSGTGGWAGGNDWAEFICGDATDGECCLETSVPVSLDIWGNVEAFSHGNTYPPGWFGGTFSVDYKLVGESSLGYIRIDFYDDIDRTTLMGSLAWDPLPPVTPDEWHHFTQTFNMPFNGFYYTIVLGATGPNSTVRYDMVSMIPYTICGCGGLCCPGNPYTFSSPGDLYGMDGWTTFGQGPGTAVVSDDVCTLTTDTVKLAHNHDNELADIGNPVPGVDDVEVIIKVLSITGDPIVKIESFSAANSTPNKDWDAALRTDTWDPAAKITGPGVYSFTTGEKGGPIPVNTAAITPTFGVSGSGAELVVDWIWVGKEGTFPYDPCPYEIAGDEDGDCRVTLNDLALMLANWLVDCIDDPANPACITP